MNDRPAQQGNAPWWILYPSIIPLLNRENPARIPHPTTSAYTLPFLLLASAVFLSLFFLSSNEGYLDRIIDNAETHAHSREQRETLELNREANKQIVRNPGIRFVIAATVAARYSLSLLVTLALFWLAIAGMSGRWESFLEFWLVATSSTGVLLLAAGIQFFLRWFFFLSDYNVSLVLLLPRPDFSGVLFNLLLQVDIFNVWFLWLLSSRCSIIYQEKTAVLFIIFISILVIEVLVSSLLHIDFLLVS